MQYDGYDKVFFDCYDPVQMRAYGEACAQQALIEDVHVRVAVSILASYAHEVLMGAILPSQLEVKAKEALVRAGYLDFAKVVAASEYQAK